VTETALAPIDASPLAFEAHLTGAVLRTADKGAKFAVRSKGEVTDGEYLRLCLLSGNKQMGFSVFVPDAQSAEDVTIPDKSKVELTHGTKKQTPSSLHRFALRTLAEEMEVDPDEFYATEMKKSTAKVWERIEDVRREKAFMGQGAQ